jgi:hypothetical protein
MSGGPVKITVRDGRAGRVGGPDGVTSERDGEILGIVEGAQPVDVGDVIALADGTKVMVIGVTENFTPTSWEQVVHVGNLP